MNKSLRLTVFWGLISLALYITVFLNQKLVMDYFTRGGFFSVVVIATALVFSFVHGAFANYFVELMGFKPVSKKGGH